MVNLLGVSREKGITEDELTIIQGVVMAVSGGRVRAQFHEAWKTSGKKESDMKKCV
jgi:hypothetical protein